MPVAVQVSYLLCYQPLGEKVHSMIWPETAGTLTGTSSAGSSGGGGHSESRGEETALFAPFCT